MKYALLTLMLIISGGVTAQNPCCDTVTPYVISMDVPSYPTIAHVARVEGEVIVEVQVADGSVMSAKARSGPAMLLEPTEKNLLTWKFRKDLRQRLVVRFHYKMLAGEVVGLETPVVTLKLPTDVEVAVHPPVLQTVVTY